MRRLTNLMTNHVARNIAADHASRHMRKAGRRQCNDEDRAVCIAKYSALVSEDEREKFESRFAEDAKPLMGAVQR